VERREASASSTAYSRPRGFHQESLRPREDSYEDQRKTDSYESQRNIDSYESPRNADSYASRIRSDFPPAQKTAKLYQLPDKMAHLVVTPDILPNSCWKIIGERVTYSIGGEVIMDFSRTQRKEKASWNKTVWFPVTPKAIVDSVRQPSKLPSPMSKTEVPKECLQNPMMMMLPRPKSIKYHAGRCNCVVQGQRETYHRESVLHDSCLTMGLVQEKMAVVPCTSEPFVENPSRFFYWNTEEKDHCLALPLPFRNGTSWTPILYKPAMSDCPDNLAKTLYYGLYSPTKAKEIGTVYMRSPKEWSPGIHPCLSEASEGSELGYISRVMYGIETVPRANYANHPLADQHFLLFVAMDPITKLVPVFLRNPDEPDMMDSVIGKMLQPFWQTALGSMMCPVCIAKDVNGELLPLYFSRSKFILHWVRLHLSSFTAVCTFSATGLNSRLYQGFIIYILARHASFSDEMKDEPEACPFDKKNVQKHCVYGTSNVLAKILNKPPAVSSPVKASERTKIPDAPMKTTEGDRMDIDPASDSNLFDDFNLSDSEVTVQLDPQPLMEVYQKKTEPSDESVVDMAKKKKKK
jgi:hypothetical protein